VGQLGLDTGSHRWVVGIHPFVPHLAVFGEHAHVGEPDLRGQELGFVGTGISEQLVDPLQDLPCLRLDIASRVDPIADHTRQVDDIAVGDRLADDRCTREGRPVLPDHNMLPRNGHVSLRYVESGLTAWPTYVSGVPTEPLSGRVFRQGPENTPLDQPHAWCAVTVLRFGVRRSRCCCSPTFRPPGPDESCTWRRTGSGRRDPRQVGAGGATHLYLKVQHAWTTGSLCPDP
jgi:hypothetical protein